MQLRKYLLAPVLAISMALPAVSSDEVNKGDSVVRVNPCEVLPAEVMARIFSEENIENAKDAMSSCRGFRQAGLERGHYKIRSAPLRIPTWEEQCSILHFLHKQPDIKWLDFGYSLNINYHVISSRFRELHSSTGLDIPWIWDIFRKIMKKNTNLTHLSFVDLPLRDPVMDGLASHKKLRFLDAAFFGVSNEFVDMVLKNCPEMHTLKITGNGSGSVMDQRLSTSLTGSGQSLREIHIQRCMVPFSALLSGVREMPQLRRIVVDTSMLPGTALNNAIFELTFVGEGVERRTIPRLMKLPGKHNPAMEEGLSYSAICLLVENCPPLKSLALSYNRYTHGQLQVMRELCPSLENLRIGGVGADIVMFGERNANTESVLQHLPMLSR